MTINLLLLKWLAHKKPKPRPGAAVHPHLKIRQVLPTLPKNQQRFTCFQDNDSPAGYRIHWRL